MKRKVLVTAVLALALLALLGFTAKPNSAGTHRLTLTTGSYDHLDYMTRGWQRAFDLSSDKGVSLTTNLTMTPEKASPKKQVVTGDLVLHTPARSMPIKIDKQEYLHYVSLPDGQYIFNGSLNGHMVGPNGQDIPVIVGVSFVPRTDKALFTISAGSIGAEAELVFGRPFLTPEAHQFMTDEMAKK